MQELQTVFKIKGSAGRLQTGSRTAAILGPWEARFLGGIRWSFEFESYETDDYWFENGSKFKLILEIGHRGLVYGPCDIVYRAGPLIIEMEVPPDGRH